MISTSALNSININRVLRTLWEKEPISRIDISKHLELDKSTITKIMTQLLERQIVLEQSFGDSKPGGGRKPIYLGINKVYGAIIGVELQTDLARVVAVSITGEILFQKQQFLNFDKTNISELFEQIVLWHKAQLEKDGWRVLGASLGIAGIVNPYERTIIQSNPLYITSAVKLDQSIDQRLGMPVFLENDTRCCCWAHLVEKKSQDPKHLMYLLGEFRKHTVTNVHSRVLAIGLAFVIDGKLHYGQNFTSGEFSSILKKDHNPTQFSTPNQEAVFLGISDHSQRKHIFHELAENIAFLTNILNLGTIGIAGDVAEYHQELTDALTESIEQNWSYKQQAQVEIVVTPFREWAVAYGAAAFVIERLFALPKMNDVQDQQLEMGIELFDLIDEIGG